MRTHTMSMGADEAVVAAAATAPVTSAQAQAAKAELGKMKAALGRWLKYRAINDQIASGASVPKAALRRPGTHLPAPAVMAVRLHQMRAARDAELAAQLYQLLSEVFDPQSLPSPDTQKNPQAAVELAQIAISGELPGKAMHPSAQGAWMWPVVVVVGIIAFVIMSTIRSSADAAAEQEKIECIKAGACTDSGFWLKIGAIAFVGWLAWDRMGLGKRVMGALEGKRRNPARRRRRNQPPVHARGRKGRLTAARRHRLPGRLFAVPENEGLPMDTYYRTKAAMSRFNQYHFDSASQRRRAYRRIVARARDLGMHPRRFVARYGHLA